MEEEEFKDLLKELKDDEGLSDYGIILLESYFKSLKQEIQKL